MHPYECISVEIGQVLAQHFDGAAGGLLQSDDRTQENGLTRTGASDNTENLALEHVKIEMVVQHMSTDPSDQTSHSYHNGLVADFVHIPSQEKVIENTASATMTRKMDSTTA